MPIKNLLKIWNVKTKPRYSYPLSALPTCINGQVSEEKYLHRTGKYHITHSSVEKSTVYDEITKDSAELSSENYSVTVCTPPQQEVNIGLMIDQKNSPKTEAKSMLLLDMSVIQRDAEGTLCRLVNDEELDANVPLHSSLSYPQNSTPTSKQNVAFVDFSDLDKDIHIYEQIDSCSRHVNYPVKSKSRELVKIPRESGVQKTNKLRVHELRRVAHRYEHKKLKAKYLQTHQKLLSEMDVKLDTPKTTQRKIPYYINSKKCREVRRKLKNQKIISELGTRPPCIGQDADDNFSDCRITTAHYSVPRSSSRRLTQANHYCNVAEIREHVLGVL